MFYRNITPILQKTAQAFPVTVLTGPRQSGKTTLLRHLFPDARYLSLESPDTLLMLKNDPRGVLSQSNLWFLDEVQNYPALFSYLQEMVDEIPGKRRFLLSGSQNFLLNKYISQTLAGRAAILELLPLSLEEYLSHPHVQKPMIWDFLWHGSYPRPYQENLDPALWYQSYIRTYLERDVRSLSHIKDLSLFQTFIKLCAGRHGQLLNLNALANDAGISQTTANEWVNILEASYIVYRLKPYFKNYNKRLVKTPKLYFYDSALVCLLLGIENASHLKIHTQRGAIFEGFMISETIKYFYAQGKSAPIYFWRDHVGLEIDLLIDKSDQLYPIELKSGETFDGSFLSNLIKWTHISHSPPSHAHLIYAGHQAFTQKEIRVTPWNLFYKTLSDMH